MKIQPKKLYQSIAESKKSLPYRLKKARNQVIEGKIKNVKIQNSLLLENVKSKLKTAAQLIEKKSTELDSKYKIRENIKKQISISENTLFKGIKKTVVFSNNLLYEFTRRKINNEIINSVTYKNFFDITYQKINPINKHNIKTIKKEILNLLIEDLPENKVLRKKINAIKNPLDLFKFLKKTLFNDYSKAEVKNINNLIKIETAKNTSIDEIEAIYHMHMGDFVSKVNRINDLLTPKSYNPQVLKIEQEIRDMGVKYINCADDIIQAKLIKRALIECKDAQIPLPESLSVSRIIPKNTCGLAVKDSENHSHIYLSTSDEIARQQSLEDFSNAFVNKTKAFRKAPKNIKLKYLKNLRYRKEHALSTTSEMHFIFHEIGHSLQKDSIAEKLKTFTSNESKIAKKISLRAGVKSGREFTPETFAKLMNREEITQEQMELYLNWGGIVPKFKHVAKYSQKN